MSSARRFDLETQARHLVGLVATVGAVLLVAACGGSDSPSSSGAQESAPSGQSEANGGPRGEAAAGCPVEAGRVSEILDEEVALTEGQVGPNPACTYLPPGTQSPSLGVIVLPFPPKDGTAESLAEVRETYDDTYAGEGGVKISDRPDWGADAFVVTRQARDNPVGQVEAFIPGRSVTVNLPVADYDVHRDGVDVADQLVSAIGAS